MTCQAARQYLQDSLDGTLPEAEHAALAAHLAACATCAQDHASLKETVMALSALPRVAAPPELLSRLSPDLDALASRPAKRPPVWAWVPGGAIAAGLLLALSLMQSPPGLELIPEQIAMEPPSSEEILQWVDASADPLDIFALGLE